MAGAALATDADTASLGDLARNIMGDLVYKLVSPLELYFPLAFVESVAARVGLVVLVFSLVGLLALRKHDFEALITDGELPSETGSLTRMREETVLSPLRRAALCLTGLATLIGLFYLELTALVAVATLMSAGGGHP